MGPAPFISLLLSGYESPLRVGQFGLLIAPVLLEHDFDSVSNSIVRLRS